MAIEANYRRRQKPVKRFMMKRRLAQLLPTGKGRWPTHHPIEQPLFAELGPAVTAADLNTWMTIHGGAISPRRWPAYIIAYDVAGKIRAAKAAGRWPPQHP